MNYILTLSRTAWTLLFLSTCQEALNAQVAADSVAEIKNIIKKSDCHTGVAVYSLKNNEFIITKHLNKPCMPASNAKLFTSLAAFQTLGKNYRFKTSLVTDGLLQEGTIKGNLYIKGAGDPSFTAADFDYLIQCLADQQIHHIEGDFCIDKEIFDTQAFAPGTSVDNLGESWNNPVGGLIIDHKAVALEPINAVPFIECQKLTAIYFDIAPYLHTLLTKYTITLAGKILFKKAPKNAAVLATHTSEPLTALVNKLNKQSDNVYADCLFKKLGSHRYKTAGTWQNGKEALQEFLHTTLGIEPTTIRLVDGSGLSRYNLVSPHHLISLLIWAHKHPNFSHFISTLPISGVDGTLSKRMCDLESKVKAKTGTMGAISALSGYIASDDDTFAFTILNNGYLSDSMYAPACKSLIEDAICRILARS